MREGPQARGQTPLEVAAGPVPHLRKEITLRHAVALYISSVLGSGVLVLPGLAAQIAGPLSLVAWLLLSLGSYPFAYTFATLSSRRPESGGVYSFAKEAFGLPVATVSGWLFALWYISGGPAVTLIAASYISYAFPMTRAESHILAAGVMLLAFLINYRGITFSNRVQVGVVVSIVVLLLAAVAFSVGSVQPENFAPFSPNGLLPLGTAAALIFWSYLGYENVSNIAEEFRDPKRDFKHSIVLSVLLVGVFYVAVATVTVGTGAYRAGGGVAPFAAIFANTLGRYGAVGTALLALFIIFGAVNAYTAGMSRVIYAVARDGGFPRWLHHLNGRSGVPDRSLVMLFGLAMVTLAMYYFLKVNLDTALLIPSGAAILVYVIGSAAGIKLLKGSDGRNVYAWISLVMSLAILPFVGFLALVSVLTGLLGLGFIMVRSIHNPQSAIHN
ncbi:MAG: amino acid permease [Bacteroidota bacterium]